MKNSLENLKSRLPFFLKFQPLLVAALLQFAPVAKFIQTNPLMAQSPLAIVLQWTVSAAALLGACHAVSGATTVAITGLTRYTNNASGVPKAVAGSLTTNVFWTNGAPGFNWRITVINHGSDDGDSFKVLPSPPPGLFIDTNIIVVKLYSDGYGGYISNTPTATGVYHVWLWADNTNCKCPISNNVTINIVASGGPPSITSVTPPNPVAFAGTNVTFNVAASGSGTLLYQWRKNGSDISGQTATNFPLLSITTNDTGSYTVVVTNSSGAVTSSPTTLKVIPLPSLSVTSSTSGLVSLEFDQYSSASYYLDYKDDLNGANWLAYSNLPAALSDVHRSVPAAATNNTRAYRERVTIP